MVCDGCFWENVIVGNQACLLAGLLQFCALVVFVPLLSERLTLFRITLPIRTFHH